MLPMNKATKGTKDTPLPGILGSFLGARFLIRGLLLFEPTKHTAKVHAKDWDGAQTLTSAKLPNGLHSVFFAYCACYFCGY